MKDFFKDFLTFIRKGNVLDLAVGIIIGGAFNTIVKSLVNDIIMPIIGLFGGTNVAEAKLVLVDAVVNAEGEIVKNAVTLNYGAFFQSIIDFLIVAFSIFLALKAIKKLHKSFDDTRKNFKKEEI